MQQTSTQHILITGANRGIGFELTRQYALRENLRIFAACRHPDAASELQRLAQQHSGIIPLPLDVTDHESIRQAARIVSQQTDTLDLLINNAGIDLPETEQALQNITPEAMQRVYAVNTIAPLIMAQAFAVFLSRSRRPCLINITSEMASISDRDYGGAYAYCASKAALNMTTRGLAVDLGRQGIICIALDPGWVQTDMGGTRAPLTPAESVSGMVSVIDQLSPEHNGSYLRWDGSTLSW